MQLYGPSHLPQVHGMRNNGMAHPSELCIFYIKIGTGLFDDFADGRVMHMRNFWEKVVLNLKIQSANQPGNQFIFCSKIGGGKHLVYGPLIFNFIGIAVW